MEFRKWTQQLGTEAKAVKMPTKSLGDWIDPDQMEMSSLQYRAMLECIERFKRSPPKPGNGGNGGGGGGVQESPGKQQLRADLKRAREELKRANKDKKPKPDLAEVKDAVHKATDGIQRAATKKPTGYSGAWCGKCAAAGQTQGRCKHKADNCQGLPLCPTCNKHGHTKQECPNRSGRTAPGRVSFPG